MEEKRLEELKQWLIDYDYPLPIIEKSFHNARLQGPAPQSKHKILPFVTTHYSNFDNQHTIMTCNNLLTKSNNGHVKEVFGDSKIVLVLK